MRKEKNGSVVIHCKIYCRNNCQFKVALFMHRIAVVVGHYNPPAWSRIWIGIGICGHSQETNEPKDLYAWQTSSSRWRQSGLTKSHQNCSLQFSLGSGFFILARSERLVCSPQSQFQSHPIPSQSQSRFPIPIGIPTFGGLQSRQSACQQSIGYRLSMSCRLHQRPHSSWQWGYWFCFVIRKGYGFLKVLKSGKKSYVAGWNILECNLHLMRELAGNVIIGWECSERRDRRTWLTDSRTISYMMQSIYTYLLLFLLLVPSM